jgi:predicted dehydrogenase
MSTLTAAIIGTGFIGPVHAEALQRAGVRVAGVLGSSREKSHAAAAALGLETGYASLEELLADPRVDVVHITTPNRFHFEQASRALAAGKHVLCEKPLAMTSAESAQLVEVAARSGKACGVNYNIRYYPLCIEAAERVKSGEVGELFHVAGSYVQDWLFHPTDFNWRVQAQEGGELRAIADIGTHWLDLIQHVTGRTIEAVCADLHTVYPERQRPLGGVETFSGKLAASAPAETIPIATEDYGCVLLRFVGGGRGVVWVSQVTAGRKNCLRYELAGSKHSLAWNSETPNELWIGQRDVANQSLVKDPALLSPTARSFTNYPGGHNEGFPDSFKQLFRDFYGAIERGDYGTSPTFPTFADGHREILLCEAILASHRQEAWVQVGATR